MIYSVHKQKRIHMKNIMKKFGFAGILAVVAMGAAHADGAAGNICALIAQLKTVFATLRILAFVGAAFVIANWAWGYISKGEVKNDDLKDKGIAMFVGFFLLFGVGMVITFLPGISGCAGGAW